MNKIPLEIRLSIYSKIDEYIEKIDKLIERQYNGLITFENCVDDCNNVVKDYKVFLNTNYNLIGDELEEFTGDLRIVMLDKLTELYHKEY